MKDNSIHGVLVFITRNPKSIGIVPDQTLAKRVTSKVLVTSGKRSSANSTGGNLMKDLRRLLTCSSEHVEQTMIACQAFFRCYAKGLRSMRSAKGKTGKLDTLERLRKLNSANHNLELHTGISSKGHCHLGRTARHTRRSRM